MRVRVGRGNKIPLTRRGCRQTMYIQMTRSLNLLRTKCTEVMSYHGTRPEKAASGLKTIPTCKESKRLDRNFLRLPEVSFRRGPATPSRKLLSTGKHARVPAGGRGGGIGVPAKTPYWRSGAGDGREGAPRGLSDSNRLSNEFRHWEEKKKMVCRAG